MTFALVALVTWLALFAVRRLLAGAGVLDVPNARSSHKVPTVRGGGVATAGAISVFVVARDPVGQASLPVALGTIAMMVMGLLDDLQIGGRGLSWRTRFGGQVLIALWMCSVGIRVDLADLGPAVLDTLGLASWPLTVLWIVGFANAFNFIDGLDGMASLQAGIIGGAGWLLLGGGGWGEIYVFIAAGALAFVPHNFPRARAFLGDSGSLSFGFLIAVASVGGARSTVQHPGVFLLLVTPMAPIIVDTGATLLRRIAHREHLAAAHREHLYQRLHEAGWSHAAVSAAYAVVTLACVAVALASRNSPPASLVVWPALCVTYLVARLYVMRKAQMP